MKKFNLVMLIFLLVFMLFNVAVAVDEQSGGENDPIVTQSYIEMRIEQVKTYCDEKVNNINTQIQSLQTQIEGAKGEQIINTFEPVTVRPGQKLIGGEGTEIILRVGTATAITNIECGIVDATGGVDILNGKNIPQQHLLIVPRDDGRGISVVGKGDAMLMVKGAYIIQ